MYVHITLRILNVLSVPFGGLLAFVTDTRSCSLTTSLLRDGYFPFDHKIQVRSWQNLNDHTRSQVLSQRCPQRCPTTCQHRQRVEIFFRVQERPHSRVRRQGRYLVRAIRRDIHLHPVQQWLIYQRLCSRSRALRRLQGVGQCHSNLEARPIRMSRGDCQGLLSALSSSKIQLSNLQWLFLALCSHSAI